MGCEIFGNALTDQKDPEVGGGAAEIFVRLSVRSYKLLSHWFLLYDRFLSMFLLQHFSIFYFEYTYS